MAPRYFGVNASKRLTKQPEGGLMTQALRRLLGIAALVTLVAGP